MDLILSGFAQVFHPGNLLIIFIGVTAGIILGALPGLTPTMGVAVLIPFTFVMDPATGLLLLGAIYASAVYAGSITAILLNIPGAPANIATTWDGHAMAMKGEARRALNLSIVASVIGGVVGCVALLLFSPPLASFALRFGPAEYFWIAVLGLTIIAGLAPHGLIKGLISGTLGVFLGVVGISTITGTARFSFGTTTLASGIHLVPAMIGLFAISQALRTMEDTVTGRRSSTITQVSGAGKFFKTALETFRGVRYWVIGSVLGTVIGIIPGAGGQVAGPVAYNEARRLDKNKGQWGTGVPAGVIAPESANNAMVGGSLVPMLTLGVPGSPTAAVLMGGLVIHGLFPGPALFSRHAEVAYTFMTGMIVIQFVLLIVAAAGAPYFSQILKVPVHVLVPAIMSLSLFGAYAIRQNVGDVVVAFVIGLSMYFGHRMGLDPASMVLGLILGPIAEKNLVLGVRAAGASSQTVIYFLSSPLSLVLVFLVVLSLAAVTIRTLKARRASNDTRLSMGNEWRRDVYTGMGVIGFAGLALAPMVIMGVSDGAWQLTLWPILVLGSLALLGATLAAVALISRRTTTETGTALGKVPRMRMIVGFTMTVAYLGLAISAGFYEATLIYALLLPFVFIPFKSPKSWKTAILTAAGITFLLYVAFERFLGIYMPSSVIG